MCIVKAAQTIVSSIFNLGFGTETPAVFVFIVRSCEHKNTKDEHCEALICDCLPVQGAG